MEEFPSDAFTIGEKVVYPSLGLSAVERIEEIGGRTYVTLSSSQDSSLVHIPLANGRSLGLRKLAGKEEFLSSLSTLSAIPPARDRKEELSLATKLSKSGRLRDTMEAVNILYRRSLWKKPGETESRLYRDTLSLLLDEGCLVLHKDYEEMRRTVFSSLHEND